MPKGVTVWMELGSWYAILGVALVIIGLCERFIIYKVLVGQGRFLPERASRVANMASISTVVVGIILIVSNFMVSRH